MKSTSRRACVAATLVAALAMSALPSLAQAAPEPTIPQITKDRISGTDRYATAIAVSQQYTSPVPVLFVATGTDFPDALSAAAAAAKLGGPLLLTPKAEVPEAVLAEAKRLQPESIIVVGGTNVVSEAVETTLAEIAPTKRWGGADRYATGLNIVESAFETSTSAIIATGFAFPDALAASSAAATNDAPVILVNGRADQVTPETLETLTKLGVKSVTIAGGKNAVSAGIETQLAAQFKLQRIGGVDRYATAAALNDAFFPAGTTATAFLATGLNFPDALSGAALAGAVGAPLYVTPTACLPDVVRASQTKLGVTRRIALGGTTVVSDDAAKALGCLMASVPSISGKVVSGQILTASTGTWTTGATLTYSWLADGTPIASATASKLTLTTALVGKKISVVVTGSLAGYATVSKTSAATVAVTQPAPTTSATPKPATPAPTTSATPKPSTPTQASPNGWDCPAWAPIKGNASSMIYHVPGGASYAKTNPEICFTTTAAAEAAGYRAAKR